MCFIIFTVILVINHVALQGISDTQLDFVSRRILKRSISFDRYLRYNEINSYLQYIENQYTNRAEYKFLGFTSEGRAIPGIVISKNGPNVKNRPMIVVDAGIHAREWIAPAVALYLIYKLMEDKKYANLTEQVDWLIIPLVNPDGYEFSHKDPKNRMWRKNRAKGERCVGVDLNRNFNFHWMEQDASGDECSDIYAGPAPFSEPETQSLRSVFQFYGKKIKMYITLHSYGTSIFYPWSFEHKKPDNDKEYSYLSNITAQNIEKVRGTKYTFGSSTYIFDSIAGVSDDWAAGVIGTPLTFTMELPAGGQSGFDPPAKDILPIVRETFVGFVTMHDYIAKKYNITDKN